MTYKDVPHNALVVERERERERKTSETRENLLHTLLHFLQHRGQGVAEYARHGSNLVLSFRLLGDEDGVDQVATTKHEHAHGKTVRQTEEDEHPHYTSQSLSSFCYVCNISSCTLDTCCMYYLGDSCVSRTMARRTGVLRLRRGRIRLLKGNRGSAWRFLCNMIHCI